MTQEELLAHIQSCIGNGYIKNGTIIHWEVQGVAMELHCSP